ncbi:MAG TPA: hypothetical protein VEJ18_01430, partial [Planctomycetota bacterium]|nr:hypothetical protein [Planctomycetota bacterium]
MLDRLNAALAAGHPARAGGAWGSSYALIAARLPRPLLLIVPTPLSAEQAVDDLACFGPVPALFEGLKQADRFRHGTLDVLVASLPEALGELPSPGALDQA